MKKYKIRWDWTDVVEANNEEDALEKSGDLWNENNYSQMIIVEEKEIENDH